MEIQNFNKLKDVNYFETYYIEKNTDLFSIAMEKNVNPNLLAILNGLDSTDFVYEGHIIMIPKDNFSYYITKEGDTINLVAQTFETSQANILKNNPAIYLKEGQLIVYKNK